MPDKNLKKLHSNLTEKWKGFTIPYDQFQTDMKDEANLKKLHANLTEKWDGFNLPYEQFQSDMGLKKKVGEVSGGVGIVGPSISQTDQKPEEPAELVQKPSVEGELQYTWDSPPPTPKQLEAQETLSKDMDYAAEVAIRKTSGVEEGEAAFEEEYANTLAEITTERQEEAKEIQDFLAKAPPTDTLTFMDRIHEVGDKPSQLVPFLSGANEAVEISQLIQAVNRLDDDIASDSDLALLKQFVENGGQDTDFWYKVMDVVAQLPSFAGELFTTGGIYTAAKTATVKGSTVLLKKLLTKGGNDLLQKKLTKIAGEKAGKIIMDVPSKVLGGIVGATAQTVPAGITRITAGTYRNMMPGFKLTQDEQGEITGSITTEGDNILAAATKSLGENWIETLSEKSGGLFRTTGRAGKEIMIRHGILKSFLKANPKAKVSDFMRVVRRSGYDGIISEMGEERLGEIGRARLGLEEYQLPTGEQLAVELVAFSIPGLTISAANMAFQEKGGTEIKKSEREPVRPEEPTPVVKEEKPEKEEATAEKPKPLYEIDGEQLSRGEFSKRVQEEGFEAKVKAGEIDLKVENDPEMAKAVEFKEPEAEPVPEPTEAEEAFATEMVAKIKEEEGELPMEEEKVKALYRKKYREGQQATEAAEPATEKAIEDATEQAEVKFEESKREKSINLTDINTDVDLFQNRQEEFSEETVTSITEDVEAGKFIEGAMDPIRIWKNPEDGKYYVLAGHSRLEAYNQLSKAGKKEFGKIPAIELEGLTLEQAQEFARTKSNILGTQETPIARSSVYSRMREEGSKESEIIAEAKKNERANWKYVYNLSALNPKGKALETLRQFESSTDIEMRGKTEAVADWVGGARNQYKDLSDTQEAELFDYLWDAYSKKKAPGKVTNKSAFNALLEVVIDRAKAQDKFDADTPLNIKGAIGKSPLEIEYDTELAELKKTESKARTELDAKRADLLTQGATKEEMDKILPKYEAKLQKAISEVEEMRKQKGLVKEAAKQQTDIFSQLDNFKLTEEVTDDTIETARNKTGDSATELEQLAEDIESKAESKEESELNEAIDQAEEVTPTEEKGTPEDVSRVHKAAKEADVDIESTEFMDKSAELTGKRHLDDMTTKELGEMEAYIKEAKPAKGEAAKPIRQLGTGANVYFESERYRVNDGKDGKVLLNVSDNAGGLTPVANIEFDTAEEAVRIAKEIEKVFPDGVPPALDVNKYVEQLRTPVEAKEEPVAQLGKAKPEGEAPKGLDRAAQGFDDLASALGAKKEIIGENRPDVIKALQDIAIGLAEHTGKKGAELIQAVKDYLKEKGFTGITDKDVDSVSEDVLTGIEKPKKKREKALLTRAYEGTEKDEVRQAISEHGLTYEVESHEAAKESAMNLIDEIGEERALKAVRNNEIVGGAGAFVWAELIDSVGRKLDAAKETSEIERLSKEQADLIDEFDKKSRDPGRFISALQEVYKTSDFGYQLDFQIEKYKAVNDGIIPIEVEAKFREYDKKLKEANRRLREAEEKSKELENKKLFEGVKEEIQRGKVSEKKIKEASKRVASAIRKGKIHRPDVFASASPGSLVWDGALEIAAKTIEAGGSIAQAIADGVKHIKESDWYNSLEIGDREGAEKAYEDFLFNKEETTEGELKIPTSIIKEFVARGIDNIEHLTTAIHKAIKGEFPDATERQVRDAITGYGKTVTMSKEEIDVKIRKMKRMGKLISGIEDVQAKKRPLRSGLQRDKLDAEERAKQKELKELMKELPIEEAELEKQWKSSLDAIKTRLRNSIEDFERRLETGEKPPKKKLVEYDAETKELKAERDRLAKAIEEIEGKPELSDEQKVKLAIRNEERRIAELERRIREHDLETPEGKPTPQTPELIALKAQKELLRGQLQKLQEEAGIPERKRLEQFKKRTQTSIDDLQERLRTKNFEPKPKKGPIEMDVETTKLKAEKDRIKELFDFEHEKAKLAQRPMAKKIWDNAFDLVMNLPKTMRATLDMSAPFRQGIVFAMRPSQIKVTARAFKAMFQQAFSEKKADDWLAYIKASPEYDIMKSSKLFLAEPNAKLSAREEVYRSNLADRIPLYKHLHKASQRAYIGFLNKMRVDAFLNFSDKMIADGYTMRDNPEIFKAWADYVNNATGRGNMGKFEMAAEKLNNFFFSPRLIAARFNTLNPFKYANMPTPARKAALKSTFEFIAMGTSVMAMASAAGGDVEDDPRSSDFGKIKIGSVRIDTWGGFVQWVRLFSQLATGERKSTKTGEITILGEDYGSQSRSDLLVNFFKYKLSPTTATALSIIEGKTALGEDVEAIDEITNLAIPLYLQDVSELLKEDELGSAGIAALIGASFFGVGVMQYDGYSEQKVKDIIRKRVPSIKVSKSKDEKEKQQKIDAKKEEVLKKLSIKYGIQYIPPKGIRFTEAEREEFYKIRAEKVKEYLDAKERK